MKLHVTVMYPRAWRDIQRSQVSAQYCTLLSWTLSPFLTRSYLAGSILLIIVLLLGRTKLWSRAFTNFWNLLSSTIDVGWMSTAIVSTKEVSCFLHPGKSLPYGWDHSIDWWSVGCLFGSLLWFFSSFFFFSSHSSSTSWLVTRMLWFEILLKDIFQIPH